MIAVVDYGMGNLRSVEKALASLGCRVDVTRDAAAIAGAEAVLLPGVGAFGDAMRGLDQRGLTAVVRQRAEEAADGGRPFLGICLGMQVLVGEGEEDPGVAGLGVIAGTCPRLRPTSHEYKVPHMGWNSLCLSAGDGEALFSGIADGSYVYFVHSYHVCPADRSVLAAQTDYGQPVCAALARGRLFATQFHPEKSQAVGLRILANFARIAGEPLDTCAR